MLTPGMRATAIVLLILTALLGCASAPDPFVASTSLLLNRVVGGKLDDSHNADLNPDFDYLRVQAAGQAPALLVLAYIDPRESGPVDVWVSGSQEVLKLQNGRIVGSSGLACDWVALRYPTAPPTWNDFVDAKATGYQRERDEMPGYRFNLREDVWVTPAQVPPVSKLPDFLPGEVAAQYRWFTESVGQGGDALPTAVFAVALRDGVWQVAYSEQCLSSNVCLQLHVWPLQK